jgi:short-subunit dehydrogenase
VVEADITDRTQAEAAVQQAVERFALPHHLLQAAEEGSRRVADIVNISSIAGRFASNGYGVYNLTKFGVNGSR